MTERNKRRIGTHHDVTIREAVDLMMEYLSGSQIQQLADGGCWADVEAPLWDFRCQSYRLKPEKPSAHEAAVAEIQREIDELKRKVAGHFEGLEKKK